MIAVRTPVTLGHIFADMPSTALVIIGHGTRDPQGVAEFQQLVAQIAAAAPEWLVESCFLELAEPAVPAGLDRAVERGASRIVALPLLLFAAGHATRDIPELIAAAERRHPGVAFHQAAHLGCHPQLVELSVERCHSVGPIDRDSTLLLLIGRGSYEPTANAEMAQFARLRWEAEPVGWYEVGYTAMTEPRVDRALAIAAMLPFSQVVVQPHLLFAGELLERIRAAVAATATADATKSWLLADHLGPSPRLVPAVLERAAAALL